MLIYVIFIILAVIGALFFDRQEQKDKVEPFFYWGLCLYLILMSGLSYALGGDKQYYLSAFERILPYGLGNYIRLQYIAESFMPGWSIVNYGVKTLFGSFYVVQIVEALILNGCVCWIVRKYTQRHFLFLLLFFLSEVYFQFNTEVMREGFAVGFGCLAIYHYEKEHVWTFVVMVLLACLFHLSAFVLLLYPMAKFFPVNRQTFVWFCLLAFGVWAVADMVMVYIIPKLTLFPQSVMDKLTAYAINGVTLYGFINLFARYMILPFVVGMCYLEDVQDEVRHKSMEHILSFALIIGVFICLGGFGFARLANYVRVFGLIWLSETLYGLIHSKTYIIPRLGAGLLYGFFACLMWFAPFPQNKAHFYDFFVPYVSIGQENENTHLRQRRMAIYREAVTPKKMKVEKRKF